GALNPTCRKDPASITLAGEGPHATLAQVDDDRRGRLCVLTVLVWQRPDEGPEHDGQEPVAVVVHATNGLANLHLVDPALGEVLSDAEPHRTSLSLAQATRPKSRRSILL